MRTLIKIGGTLLDTPELRERIARQIAGIAANSEIAVVHGGGKQITRYLHERGIESRFVNGMRVTTPEILEAVLTVLRRVNGELAMALEAAGVRANALFVDDGTLVEAERMDPELGAVGRVVRCHPEPFSNGGLPGLPVVACIAGDRQGNRYNVNGDLMAVACASGFRAQRLVFLTDVEGVLDAAKNLIPSLTTGEAAELIGSGVAKGGMQAKLNAATQALHQGVRHVHIAPGAADAILERAFAGEPAGTRITA